MHVAIRKQEKISAHSKKPAKIEVEARIRTQAQSGAQIGTLLFDKALTEVLEKHSNYSNVFLAKNAVEFLENSGINEHAIKLEKDK